ncbi:uncharacterized protein [Paramormyrops kingsleyae]|uniref:uncharacterized protein n=1 Tax=Paramormyrops kingsleyae TaxID=1676925 RepID=UPI003B977783
MFPTEPENLDKLLTLFKGTISDRQTILRFTDNTILNIKDLMSICPQSLIDLTVSQASRLPWLTDDAVNSRVAQIAKYKTNTMALATHQFIVWHREWQTNRNITDNEIEPLKDAEKVLWPRIVGGSLGPEWGNHFILWVFDVPGKEVRIYDSSEQHNTIDEEVLEMLRHIFRQHDSLNGWTISCPQMWKHTDDFNCGVFVCTMAETDVKETKMSPEVLQPEQLCHLRLYHASCLVKDISVSEQALPALKRRRETERSRSCCLAQGIYACVYQKIRKKSMHPEVKTINWVQCDYCDGWLHSECAGTDPSTFDTDTPFSCGCHFPEPYPYKSVHAALREGLVVRMITDEEIMTLQNDLVSGTLKSNRMYLHQNPSFDPKLKQLRDTSISVFDEKQIEAIIERTFAVFKLDKSSMGDTSFILEVMVPEVTVLILRKLEGFNRYQAETTFAKYMSF